jgi:signal-transduction protein with cAMP-binding, CBS, and nucleotidyltransferase domain
MAHIEQNDQWTTFCHKEAVAAKEEWKSKVMLSLKQIPFLVNLGWERINELTDSAAIREFQKEECFCRKGQAINHVFLLLQGQMAREQGGHSAIIEEGSSLFVESIIALTQADHNYYVTSSHALICGVDSFRIYELAQQVSRQRE